jgi:hypothetical protein
VKFLRHLTAVVLAVAVIVGLGMLWAYASSGAGLRQAPSHQALLRPEQIKTVPALNQGTTTQAVAGFYDTLATHALPSPGLIAEAVSP